jgi:hypothetical protein
MAAGQITVRPTTRADDVLLDRRAHDRADRSAGQVPGQFLHSDPAAGGDAADDATGRLVRQCRQELEDARAGSRSNSTSTAGSVCAASALQISRFESCEVIIERNTMSLPRILPTLA